MRTHLPRLLIDLQSQFSGRSQDQGERVLFTAAVPSIVLRMKELMFTRRSQKGEDDLFVILFAQYLSIVFGSLQSLSWSFRVDLTQHGQQEGSSLARA